MLWNLKSCVHNNNHVRLTFDWRAAVLGLGPKRRFRKKGSASTHKTNAPKVVGFEKQRQEHHFVLPMVNLCASNVANTMFHWELTTLSQQYPGNPISTSLGGGRRRVKAKPPLFWVNNKVNEWTAQLMAGLKHIVDFIVHTDWVRSLMRKYAVWTVGLRGAWLIWSTESHLSWEQKSARERTGGIGYQGNTYKCVSIGGWNEGRGCFIGHNTHFEMRMGGVRLEGGGCYFFHMPCFLDWNNHCSSRIKFFTSGKW